MADIRWATHVPQGLNQRAAMAKAGAIPNDSLSSDCVLQPVRMKLKPLVIVHHNVTVKITQALHTPPITPGKCALPEVPSRRGGVWVTKREVRNLGEVDTR